MPETASRLRPLPQLPSSVVAAIARGDAGPLDAWLDSDDSMDNIDSVDTTGRTALMTAIGCSQHSIAMDLIELGTDVNLTHPRGTTALMIAAFTGDLSLVLALIDAGAQVDAIDSRGLTAHQFALSKNHGAVAFVLEHAFIEPSSRPASPPTVRGC